MQVSPARLIFVSVWPAVSTGAISAIRSGNTVLMPAVDGQLDAVAIPDRNSPQVGRLAAIALEGRDLGGQLADGLLPAVVKGFTEQDAHQGLAQVV